MTPSTSSPGRRPGRLQRRRVRPVQRQRYPGRGLFTAGRRRLDHPKAGASTLLLATDIILESLDASSLTFGDILFINPPATTTTPGVVELADAQETQDGLDGTRAVTPRG
ncbi:hypothetical protein I0D68_20095 [Pseudomonas lalucatii]|nr:hypothetical protein I0D68_20095 [Pseudomonas lalucatii]